MSAQAFTLRPYAAADEDAAIELWRRTWQTAYPHDRFRRARRLVAERWRSELVPRATIVVAEAAGRLVGFVTVEPDTGYLDQIVVAPECWGGGLAETLLAEARRLSPTLLVLLVNNDNARAIRFYEKHGFTLAGDDVNPVSGRPVYRMRWRP